MRFCPNCGSEINSTANFCSHCGANLKVANTDFKEYNSASYVPERGFSEKFLKIEGRLNPARYVLRLTAVMLFYGILICLLIYSVSASVGVIYFYV